MGQSELINLVFKPNLDKWLSLSEIKEMYKDYRPLPLRRLVRAGIVKERWVIGGEIEYMMPSKVLEE